ncbi:MAG: RnfH family protein [Idiomarina sp.]|nr:RnfH family protein [Idiomarina sp.]
MEQQLLTLEVVYALPERQKIMVVQVAAESTVEQAIEQSGIMQHFDDIDLTKNSVGIWNKTCKLSDQPRNGDRIEIYRPLVADPKEIRRRRAEKAKLEGRADKVTGGRLDEKRK